MIMLAGMGIVNRPIGRLPSHPHPPKLKEIPKVLPQVTGVPVHLPFGLATAPQVFTMIVKEVKLMALTSGLRLHQYLDDWLIRSQSQEKAQVNTQAVVDLTQSLGWIINQEKSELKPTRVFSFVGYEYHLHSALVKPTQERWLKLQDLILRPKSKHVLTARWFTPHVDLFPTHLNHKLPLYVSLIPDPKDWDIDALNINWAGLTAYAYPPTALIHRVIQKIRQCHCLIIVIAPGWPGMPWFWDLVQRSTEIPLQLPVSTTLLKQSHKYVFHNNPHHLNLHACCLGADNSKNKASLWRWQRELLPLSGHQQRPSTSQSGPYLKNGVEKILFIYI